MTMRINHRQAVTNGEKWVVQLQKSLDDGTTEEGCHVFPKETLEWRVAEYGIDPADVDTLLDVVLTEPYLTPEDWATGYQLHNAPDIATAREDHIARCARAKLRHRISTRGASNSSPAGHPLDVIRRDHGIDIAVVAVKAEHIARIREHTAQQAARAAADPGLSRADRVRRELGLDEPKKADTRGGGRR